MSLPVLLLLSLWTVPCGGCDFDWEVVKNIKSTIDSNPTGFRRVFPKDYNVTHHYTQSMLCDTDPDSWNKLHKNLWDEHLNYSFILDLKMTLETIIGKNRNAMLFQEEVDWSLYPSWSSSPEELLKLTSQFIARWLQVGCSPSIRTCALPTQAPSVVREDFPPSRARLLTTRAVSSTEQKEEQHKEVELKEEELKGEELKEEKVQEEEVQDEKNEQEKAEEQMKMEEEVMEKEEEKEEEEQSPHRRMDGTRPPPSSRTPPLLSTPVWSPLLFRLYWWLLP